MKKMKWT